GEIGMNFYLYGCQGKWIAVECGITFGNETTPGIDVMMADPAFLETVKDDLLGIVLTHAHEDHQGATAHLWPRLECPVYATAFTCGLVRTKIAEAGLESQVPLKEMALKSSIELGPFKISLITVTHSILEPNALSIETPFGTLIHTGDWKLDPDPLIGDVADETTFRKLGDKGVLAMVCDSTNVFVEGDSGSEGQVREALVDVIGQYKDKGRVAVACFASNMARVESISHAARANGRDVALVGRSLWKYTEIARDCGYIADVPPFLTEHDAGFLPPSKVLLICTGSQGERGSALARISEGDHPVVLEPGDTVLFSSRNIPGNERGIYAMQNRLARMGAEIVTSRNAPIHVSGHPARDELAKLYEWVRPEISVPMHGESRHLMEHAGLARELGVKQSFVVSNGNALKLAPGNAEIVGQVPTGRLGIDGNRLVVVDEDVFRERRRMTFGGMAFVTVALDHKDRLVSAPSITLRGLGTQKEESNTADDMAFEIEQALEKLGKKPGKKSSRKRVDHRDDAIAEQVRRAARRAIKRNLGKKPGIEVHIFRL
ncbi:MAG: ribonuclease J, partial [Rhodospirillales bacterium]|nr:ribonuclease J [Rhodospirillales bacterium]